MVLSDLRKHHDLVRLWTDCRNVCRQFKDDVERIFRTKYLITTTITFDCGRSGLSPKMDLAEAESGIWESEEILGLNVYLSDISFGFDRLANEGETAVFKLEGGKEDFIPEIMSRVSYCRLLASKTLGPFPWSQKRHQSTRSGSSMENSGRSASIGGLCFLNSVQTMS